VSNFRYTEFLNFIYIINYYDKEQFNFIRPWRLDGLHHQELIDKREYNTYNKKTIPKNNKPQNAFSISGLK